MKRILAFFFTLGFVMCFLATPVSAVGGCVTHGEYDNLEWGLSPEQVANRFETNGSLINVGEDFFKRGYPACWDDTRKVVIWYDLNLGLSDHWDIRDR